MTRLGFGAFLAPHHPIGEHPTLQLRRDLDLAEHLDKLGYDEFWCGEHHSTGWEVIASPEMFLAAAGERTERIKLGTGVVSLPFHHPFTVAQRIVQLDHMTRGRVIFGTGPGALPSDAYTLGIDPVVTRDRQDEALGVIRRLMRGEERFDYQCEWFTLRAAKLQLLPLQEELPMAVASMISPSGMTLAGKYGIGVLSIGSNSTAGLDALPTQWSFAEEAAKKHGSKVSRRDWRVLMSFHIAESREQARKEAGAGFLRWHNEYTVGTLMRPGGIAYDNSERAFDEMSGTATVVGTPDDLVKAIRELQRITGGFGTMIGFAHDWASREATFRSWELVARHVIPEVNGMLDSYRESQKYVIEHREAFERGVLAVMTKINENERAARALAETGQVQARAAFPGHHQPSIDDGGAAGQKQAAAKKEEDLTPAKVDA